MIKRSVTALILVIMLLCIGLKGCPDKNTALNYSEHAESDGFYIAVNKRANCCFVGYYDCKEYTDNMEITIPDEYKSIPVKRIGGYFGRGYPVPFGISMGDLYNNVPEGSEYNAVYSGDIRQYDFEDNYSVENLVFTVNIGKNIDTIVNVDMDVYYTNINKDGSITFYHPVVYVNCSDENKHFYSKSGKLYYKETNELVSDFSYVS